MDVLIKGMKMPTDCYNCRLRYFDGEDDVCIFGGEIMHGDERRDDCPLILVPPHGRLIDEQWLKDAMITTLEALKKNPKMGRQEMHLIAAFDTLRVMVEDAPTVIEAEEDER